LRRQIVEHTYVDSFVERAETGQVDERGLVDRQPDADAQDPGADHLQSGVYTSDYSARFVVKFKIFTIFTNFRVIVLEFYSCKTITIFTFQP
jgi:hypothetical protein